MNEPSPYPHLFRPLDLGFTRTSEATLEWAIPADAVPGSYKLCYSGDHLLSHTAKAIPFTGCSSIFQVVA